MLDSAGATFTQDPQTTRPPSHLAAGLNSAFELVQHELVSLRRQAALQEAKIRAIESELLQAARLQRELMPLHPPQLANCNVTIVHRAAGAISGDLIHTAGADRHRATFSLADAAGHGVAAGLLAAFVHRAFRDIEFSPSRGPQEVLERVNRILFDTGFSDGCFITAVHASFDAASRMFQWARGGAPYPILVRPSQVPTFLQSAGPLLGVHGDAAFETASCRLNPGEAVIICTDGLDAFLRGEEHGASLEDSDWLRDLRAEKLTQQLDALRDRIDRLAPSELLDDVTLLALQVEN